MSKKTRYDFSSLQGYKIPAPIANAQIVFPVQQRLFGEDKKDRRTRYIIGDFYEHLNTAIFGGEHHSREQFEEGAFLVCEPDTTKHDERIHFESKAVCRNGDCKLSEYQTSKYLLLQNGNGLYKSPRIRYSIFLHNNKGISKRTGGKHKLIFSELSQNTDCLLSLPFSVILAIYRKKDYTSTWVRREQGEIIEQDPMSRLRPKQIFQFMSEPENTLEYFSVNPEDYLIHKRQLPKGMRINNKEIKPFPILLVVHKNHAVWTEFFRENENEEIEKAKEVLEDKVGRLDLSHEKVLFENDLSDIPF